MNRKSIAISMLLAVAAIAHADVKLPSVFNSKMVIQRDTSAPIWGWADPDEKVSVAGSWGAKAEIVADKNGKWQLKLATPPAGGPFSITVQGKNKLELADVLSGDVWLCSGQSNMFMSVLQSNDAQKEIAGANYPEIRLFKVKSAPSLIPISDPSAQWEVCSPSTVPGFSAAGYFFGRKLYQEMKIPIGLIQSSVNGTCIEAWTQMEKQINDPVVKSIKDNYDNQAKYYNAEAEKKKYEALRSEWEAKMTEWKKAGSKGKAPAPPSMVIHPHKQTNYPSNLYNGMINPIVPYAIKGAIWYQGESNARRVTTYRVQLERLITSWREVWNQGDFAFYFVQLPNFMKPWSLPVEENPWPMLREIFMDTAKEVPNTGMAITIDIGEANDIHPRNKQDVGDRLARVALYRTYDKKDIIWSGPVFKSCKFDGPRAIVSFDTGGAPLAVKGDKLQGFALVDDTGKTVKAEAVIQGDDTVVVSSPEIKKAVKVYYAWANNPVGVNLINKGGLPASPFRCSNLAK